MLQLAQCGLILLSLMFARKAEEHDLATVLVASRRRAASRAARDSLWPLDTHHAPDEERTPSHQQVVR